jgi:hypothetical protein
LRLRWPISWALRTSGGVAWIERVAILAEARERLLRVDRILKRPQPEQGLPPLEDSVARWRREMDELTAQRDQETFRRSMVARLFEMVTQGEKNLADALHATNMIGRGDPGAVWTK